MYKRILPFVGATALALAGLVGAVPSAHAQTFCTSSPRACGFPDATNTGYGTAYSNLKVVNSQIDITTPGETLSYVNTDQPILVDAPNVTIHNVRVDVSNGNFGIELLRGASNTTIRNSTIRGAGTTSATSGIEAVKDIYGTGNTVWFTHNNVYDFGDGIQSYSGSVKYNYIHGLNDVNGYHLEDVNENGNSGGKLLIYDNTLLNSSSQTAAIYLGCDFTFTANVTVNHNLMAGGGYTFYGGAGSDGPHCNPSNIVVTNNIFSRVYFSNYGFWGPVAYFSSSAPGDQWSNNRDDNGTSTGGSLIGS